MILDLAFKVWRVFSQTELAFMPLRGTLIVSLIQIKILYKITKSLDKLKESHKNPKCQDIEDHLRQLISENKKNVQRYLKWI